MLIIRKRDHPDAYRHAQGCPNDPGILIEFIEGKLLDAFASVRTREQMEANWKSGADSTWRAVGCKLNKAQRLKESKTHGRIAAKLRGEIALFKAVKNVLNQL